MLSNERINALIATDREVLVELLAMAYLRGAGRAGFVWHGSDMDVKSLMVDAQRLITQPALNQNDIARWEALAEQGEL
jgi:hypothetical protein